MSTNRPLNKSNWDGDCPSGDARWQFGSPPTGNTNYAWQHYFIHHLAPDGFAFADFQSRPSLI